MSSILKAPNDTSTGAYICMIEVSNNIFICNIPSLRFKVTSSFSPNNLELLSADGRVK
jgi:hypothetical protein